MTWHDVLSEAAGQWPDRTAFTFHAEEAGPPARFSYADLDRRSRAIAADLIDRGLAGRPVLLLFPAGLDYVAAFFGCLYAGAVAVPAYPPQRHRRSVERVVAIMRDCAADTALTTATVRDRLTPRLSEVPELAGLRLIATDTVADSAAAAFTAPPLDDDSLAFLQYTSGSTASPRGVVLTHRNLLANTTLIRELFALPPDMRGVSWLPMYHDMGLIGSVMATVARGGSMALMAPATFARDPFRWLSLISAERANVSGGPNFAYDLCVEQITEEQKEQLDLSCWEVAFNGAEPVRESTLRRFADAFAVSGFRSRALLPCYGLAEASLVVSAGPAGTGYRSLSAGDGAGRPLVASGALPPQQRVEVVDPESGAPVPDGVEGEIWVHGPSVAQGYFNRAEATEQTFGATLAGTDAPRFLRTGDLGFLRDGQLVVTGRRKDLIVIRGRNHYPQDIELTAGRCSPALRPNGGAAFSVPGADGAESLVVVHELRHGQDEPDLGALARDIQAAVAEEHEVRPAAVVLIRTASLPRTSSGKVARYACRAAYLADELLVLGMVRDEARPDHAPVAAAETVPVTPQGVTDLLLACVAELTGMSPDQIDASRFLAEVGLDSLETLRLQHLVQRRLGVTTAAEQWTSGSIADLAAALAAARRQEPQVSEPEQSGAGDRPLTDTQRAMWFLQQLAPHSSGYHVSLAVGGGGGGPPRARGPAGPPHGAPPQA
ncbi:AMP-binding protein, partial [Actinoplanes sp. NEAU-A12]